MKSLIIKGSIGSQYKSDEVSNIDIYCITLSHRPIGRMILPSSLFTHHSSLFPLHSSLFTLPLFTFLLFYLFTFISFPFYHFTFLPFIVVCEVEEGFCHGIIRRSRVGIAVSVRSLDEHTALS